MNDMLANQNNAPGEPRPRSKSWIVAVLVGLVGVAAGFYWHDSLTAWVSSNRASDNGESKPSSQLWTCGMHPQVIQDHPGVCPICHMKLTPLRSSGLAASGPAPSAPAPTSSTAPFQPGTSQGRRIKYWTDPMMNPPYISEKAGKSPMGMDLVPVYEDQNQAPASTALTIDPAVVQNMGVRLAVAEARSLSRTIRAVGYLDEAQPAIRDINLRVSGWIQQLEANTEGMHVERGDPLFELYSPELQVGIDELIAARQATIRRATSSAPISSSGQSLLAAATRKLESLGLQPDQIEAYAKLERAPATVTFTSPITGHVTEKLIVAGAAVKAGERVLRIVDHSVLWLDIQIFEQDLPYIAPNQDVVATIAARPGESFHGQIMFIHPHVDPLTRTGKVRVAIPNAALALRPGMYAVVEIKAEVARQSVAVPREAVIDSGTQQLCFVSTGDGHFEARRVVVGFMGDNASVQILDGISAGESVVISGQFLLDSESRLREAIQKFLSERTSTASRRSAANRTPLAQPLNPQADSDPLNQSAGVLAAYLNLAQQLGSTDRPDAPIDPGPLIARARTLQAPPADADRARIVLGIKEASEALADQPLAAQRAAFIRLSAAVIELVEKTPQAVPAGKSVFQMHCPMAPGDWLQAQPGIANPFYGPEMKDCGELVKTIQGSGGGK